MKSPVKIAIISYPGCMHSCLLGLQEMFNLASMLCQQGNIDVSFMTETIHCHALPTSAKSDAKNLRDSFYAVIVPPSIEGKYYLQPEQSLLTWLAGQHGAGTVMCSTCAGAFILAAAGLLDNRDATTHWQLADQFSAKHPAVKLDSSKILINRGDLITSGGLMARLDLGFELIANLAGPAILRQLGKLLVVDTGMRQQRYYQSFSPRFDHGDAEIIKAQHYLAKHIDRTVSMTSIAGHCHLGQRTFLRRFIRATGLKPTSYLQKLRIQQGCEHLETTTDTIEQIAARVGYEDAGSFRKVFAKIMGLTPKEFRSRFSGARFTVTG